MASKRSIIIFWILLLVPTLIIVGVAFLLLSHEEERINRSAVLSLEDRARAISETIQITVTEVESALTDSLFRIDPNRLKPTLLLWEETNPLVRNVFIWNETSRLVYPVQGLASTSEERRFISRFASFFSGRSSWESPVEASTDDPSISTAPGTDTSGRPLGVRSYDVKERFARDMTRLKTGRRRLLDMATAENEPALPNKPAALDPTVASFKKKSGWIPWFAGNRLFILGWVKPWQGGPVYGVELEMMTLLSRLIADFPVLPVPDTAWALVDGSRQILHQSGDIPVDWNKKPDVTLSLSRRLPHWQIVGFLDGHNLNAGKGFFIISGILLAIFVIAIVSGAVLLTRQAHLSRKEGMEKSSFVSSVSHELKTPLTSIRMYGELLQSKRVTDQKKQEHYLSVIVTESQRLTRLVNNVLDFGRLEEGRKQYYLESFDLGEFLNGFVDAHAIRIKGSGLTVRVSLPDKSMLVTTDRDALEQVILNLVDNALKYASDGEMVDFILNGQEEGFYDLKLCDRGPGIPPAHRLRIFEKFHRIDNSLTSSRPGSGLGLSIARRILRDLGGDLLFEPGKNGGSCFIARILKDGKHTHFSG